MGLCSNSLVFIVPKRTFLCDVTFLSHHMSKSIKESGLLASLWKICKFQKHLLVSASSMDFHQILNSFALWASSYILILLQSIWAFHIWKASEFALCHQNEVSPLTQAVLQLLVMFVTVCLFAVLISYFCCMLLCDDVQSFRWSLWGCQWSIEWTR